jgi:uncharacterized protein
LPRVVHFEIHADDLDRAERFYTDAFGWDVRRVPGLDDYRLVITGPAAEPGIDGAIMQRRLPIDGQAMIAYVCTIDVDDIGATEEGVIAGGGQQVLDRMTIPGVGYVSYFKDTEGNVFGAIQNDPQAGASG